MKFSRSQAASDQERLPKPPSCPLRTTPRRLLRLSFYLLIFFTFSPLSTLLPSSFHFQIHGVASADSNASFFPTWKLLSPAERKLFIGGYIHGWKDSKRLTEILKSHVSANPDKAVSSLEKVREIYGSVDIPVETIVDRLTSFYENPENHDAPLSVAISAARSRE